jgi:hypothetical protein
MALRRVWKVVRGHNIGKNDLLKLLKDVRDRSKTPLFIRKDLAHLAREELANICAIVGWTGMFAVAVLNVTAIYRKKVCLGSHVFLNPNTCKCECFGGYDDNCTYDNAPLDIYNGASWVWNNVAGVIMETDELLSCHETCCAGQVVYQSVAGCGCACLGDITFGNVVSSPSDGGSGDADSYWKQDSGCPCTSKGLFYNTRGKCVSRYDEHRRQSLGQAWDSASCDFHCPNNTGGKQIARAPNGHATPNIVTYTDYNGATQTEYSLCDGTCVDPGVCTDGYAFNNDITICGCQKICGENTAALRWTESGAGPNQWIVLYSHCDSVLPMVPHYPSSAGATDIYDGSPVNYQYNTVICEPCQSSSYGQNIQNLDSDIMP